MRRVIPEAARRCASTPPPRGRALDVFPDGRVLVTLPPTALPFGVALRATVLYPNLRAFLAAMRAINRPA